MGSGFLKTDRSIINICCVVTALMIFFTISRVYSIDSQGCGPYVEHLKSCTPYKCTQHVVGFERKYLGHTSYTVKREIVGSEQTKSGDATICKVTEIDNADTNEYVTCKYSERTRKTVLIRAGMLFGTTPLPDRTDDDSPFSSIEIATKRASYITRTPEQLSECVTYTDSSQ